MISDIFFYSSNYFRQAGTPIYRSNLYISVISIWILCKVLSTIFFSILSVLFFPEYKLWSFVPVLYSSLHVYFIYICSYTFIPKCITMISFACILCSSLNIFLFIPFCALRRFLLSLEPHYGSLWSPSWALCLIPCTLQQVSRPHFVRIWNSVMFSASH